MQTELQEILVVIGRLLLGGLFVAGGSRHFFIIPRLSQKIAQRGVPAPVLVLLAGTVFQIAAGILLILGVFVPWAALGLIVFTLAASFMLLNFWSMEGAEKERTINVWQSNFAVIGGLLLAAAHSMQV